MRGFLIFLTCLMLATTSVRSAVMMSEMKGSVEIIICADASNTGQTALLLDATGKPISKHRGCIVCLTGAAATLPMSDPLPAPPQTHSRSKVPPAQVLQTSRPVLTPMARGPPNLV
jgi:hypothetical protein